MEFFPFFNNGFKTAAPLSRADLFLETAAIPFTFNVPSNPLVSNFAMYRLVGAALLFIETPINKPIQKMCLIELSIENFDLSLPQQLTQSLGTLRVKLFS